MKALIKNGIVQNLSDTKYPSGFVVFDGMEWVDCPDDCQPGWKYIDGQFIAPEQPKPTKEQQLKLFDMSIQNYIDGTAASKSYSNGVSCASYYSSSNTQWKAEANVFIAWRDRVWENFEIERIAIDAGADVPDTNAFIASLPQIVWP